MDDTRICIDCGAPGLRCDLVRSHGYRKAYHYGCERCGLEVEVIALPSIVLGFVAAGILLGLTILGGMRAAIEVPSLTFTTGIVVSFGLVLQGVFRVVRRGQILSQPQVRKTVRPRRATFRNEVLRSVTPPGTRLPADGLRSLAQS